MLKIYHAYIDQGEVVLEKGINFREGVYNSGRKGYGKIGIDNSYYGKDNHVLYSIENAFLFEKRAKNHRIANEPFILNEPYNSRSLSDYMNSIELESFRTLNSYDFRKYNLNEERILLFTEWIKINYNNPLNSTLFSVFPEKGMYLFRSEAQIEMAGYPDGELEPYEVIQNNGQRKQLYLVKMDSKR